MKAKDGEDARSPMEVATLPEYMKRHHSKEEEFLDEFYGAAVVASKLLESAWSPDPHCDDASRKNRDYFLKSGELHQLTFSSGTVYHDGNGFSSVQIVLESCDRIVTVRVSLIDGELVGEKIVDKPRV